MKYGMHAEKTWNNPAEVIRWVDGDTVDVMIDAGYDVHIRIRLRLRDIDTPERGEANYKEATKYGESLAPVGSTVFVMTKKYDRTFNRYVGEMFADKGEDHFSVNEAMVASGFAKDDVH